MNSDNCEFCKIDVHGASYVEHLRSKKHLEKEKQYELILPESLFEEPIEKKLNKYINLKP